MIFGLFSGHNGSNTDAKPEQTHAAATSDEQEGGNTNVLLCETGLRKSQTRDLPQRPSMHSRGRHVQLGEGVDMFNGHIHGESLSLVLASLFGGGGC